MFLKYFIVGVVVCSSAVAQSKDPLGDKIKDIEAKKADPLGAKIQEVEEKRARSALSGNLISKPKRDAQKEWESHYMKEMEKRKLVLEKILSKISAEELSATTPAEMDRLIETELKTNAPTNCTKIESEYFACPEGTYTFSGSKLPKAIEDSSRAPKEVLDKTTNKKANRSKATKQ